MKRNTYGIFKACATASRYVLTLVASATLATGLPARAQETKNETNFRYRAYSETEIQQALQRTLNLEDCIGIALSKNIILKLAEKDLERAENTHAGSFGTYLPILSLDGSKTNASTKEPDSLQLFSETLFENQANVVGRAQLYIPTGATFVASHTVFRDVQTPFNTSFTKDEDRQFSLSLTQPLLRGFGPAVANNRALSTGNTRNAQKNILMDQKWQIVFEVKQAYYNVLVQRELLKVNEATVSSDSALVNASEALVVAKLASRRDVLSAQIRYDEDRAALIAGYKLEYQTLLDVLKDFMGIPLNTAIVLVEESFDFSPIKVDESRLVARALENNSLLRSLEYNVREAKLQRSIAKNAVLPRLDVYGSYSSSHASDLILHREQVRSGSLQAGLTFSYNFLHREAGAAAQNAEITVQQQEERLIDARRQIELSIREVARSLSNSEKEVTAIKRSIEAAEQKFDFARTMFNLGRASNLDVTDAQEFLLRTKTLYLRKLVSFRVAMALLESFTGENLDL